MRTPRGRVATPKAFEHLGMSVPASAGEGDQLPLSLDNEGETETS
jgi:hypothetical protein